MALTDRLRAAPRDPAALAAWLAALRIDAAEIDALRAPDPRHPYGRRVLLSEGGVEAMLATWTPGAVCAPHDHGGAAGAVRVVSGACEHTTYRPDGDALVAVSVARHAAGDVLPATVELVHGMRDLGDGPLVTLHVYLPGIPRMVVYDVPGRRTLVVDGGCGAWVPEESAIRAQIAGFVAPSRV